MAGTAILLLQEGSSEVASWARLAGAAVAAFLCVVFVVGFARATGLPEDHLPAWDQDAVSRRRRLWMFVVIAIGVAVPFFAGSLGLDASPWARSGLPLVPFVFLLFGLWQAWSLLRKPRPSTSHAST
jgi:hypothetical protein